MPYREPTYIYRNEKILTVKIFDSKSSIQTRFVWQHEKMATLFDTIDTKLKVSKSNYFPVPPSLVPKFVIYFDVK